MSGQHNSSSLLCEVQESSGNSDSALDTDAYLESLIRKQKIPRTQNYNPSVKADSFTNQNKQGDQTAGKAKPVLTGHSNLMQGQVHGNTNKLAFKMPNKQVEEQSKSLATTDQEITNSVVELAKVEQSASTAKFGSQQLEEPHTPVGQLTTVSQQVLRNEKLGQHSGEDGGGTEGNADANNDPSKVQKSHPTPKNTPLGYHNRKKNINKKVNEFDEIGKNYKSPTQVTQGSDSSKLKVQDGMSQLKAASLSTKNQLILASNNTAAGILAQHIGTDESEADMLVQSIEKNPPSGFLDQQDTVVRQPGGLALRQNPESSDAPLRTPEKQKMVKAAMPLITSSSTRSLRHANYVDENPNQSMVDALMDTVTGALQHFNMSRSKLQEVHSSQQITSQGNTSGFQTLGSNQSYKPTQGSHQNSLSLKDRGKGSQNLLNYQQALRMQGHNLTSSSSPQSPKSYNHMEEQVPTSLQLHQMFDSALSQQTRQNFESQLLKQNQNLSLQVYQLNNKLLQSREALAKNKQRLDSVCVENGQLTSEIVGLQQRCSELEVTVMALERHMQRSKNRRSGPQHSQMTQQSLQDQAGRGVNHSHQSFVHASHQSRSPDRYSAGIGDRLNTAGNLSNSQYYPSPISNHARNQRSQNNYYNMSNTAQMSTYIPPSRLTMDSNEVLQSPNFNQQQKNRMSGDVTPPVMNQNFMDNQQQQNDLELQKQFLIEQLKQELNQGQSQLNHRNPIQQMRKKSRTRDMAASMNHHPHQMLYHSQNLNDLNQQKAEMAYQSQQMYQSPINNQIIQNMGNNSTNYNPGQHLPSSSHYMSSEENISDYERNIHMRGMTDFQQQQIKMAMQYAMSPNHPSQQSDVSNDNSMITKQQAYRKNLQGRELQNNRRTQIVNESQSQSQSDGDYSKFQASTNTAGKNIQQFDLSQYAAANSSRHTKKASHAAQHAYGQNVTQAATPQQILSQATSPLQRQYIAKQPDPSHIQPQKSNVPQPGNNSSQNVKNTRAHHQSSKSGGKPSQVLQMPRQIQQNSGKRPGAYTKATMQQNPNEQNNKNR